MSKADNMLAILWLLKSRKRITAKQLSEELGVHIRTIYRNIDALCISGVPVISEIGRDGGYYIPEHIKLEPCFLMPMSKRRFFMQPHSHGKQGILPKSR